jgi:hypothetical protein
MKSRAHRSLTIRIQKFGMVAGLVTLGFAGPALAAEFELVSSVENVVVAVGWVCDRADSICGLDDPKMLSKPAKVDYDALYKATSEYKKIRDEKIDPNSSEGIQLRQRAVDRIRDKTESIRSQNGYCSVWKSIKHQDGRVVPDITDQVKALL